MSTEDTESELSYAEVQEAVEMAWSDATRLPEGTTKTLVCEYLRHAAEAMDEIFPPPGGP